MALLEVVNLTKRYKNSRKSKVTSVQDINLSIREKEFVSLLGPSGCGKTTLLMCIAGLKEPTSGKIVLEGKEIIGPQEEIGLLFQEYNKSLFYWKNARENVSFGIQDKNLSERERQARIRELLKKMGLENEGEKYPHELSGGMQQRVALARMLAYDPSILLMDEPFGSLDISTRQNLQEQLLQLWRELEKTVVYVTHDIKESIYLSDRVVILDEAGREVDRLTIGLQRPRQKSLVQERKFEQYENEICQLLNDDNGN